LIGVEIDISELTAAVNAVERLGDEILPSVDQAVGRTAAEGARLIVEKAPKITGNLRRGFQLNHVGQTVWRIFNLIKYAPFIEYGERQDKRWPGKTIYRQAGPAEMVQRSIGEIQKRLAKNIDAALAGLIRSRFA
jgi:hypothetical protein